MTYEKRSVAAYQKYPYMHRTAVDAILDTVLAHLPPKKIPALNKREEGYNVKELKDAKD